MTTENSDPRGPLTHRPAPSDGIRPADDRDLLVLPELETASDTVFAVLGITDLPPAGTVAELRAADAVLVWAAPGAPPDGFARIDTVEGHAHLEQLAVRPERARRGIGGALVEAVAAWARDRGDTELTLTTYRDVPWNGPFYARHGFAEVAEPTPALAAILAAEAELGLTAHGARIAMRRAL